MTYEIPALWAPIDTVVNHDSLELAAPVAAFLQQTGACPDEAPAARFAAAGAQLVGYAVPAANGPCAHAMARAVAVGFAIDDLEDDSADSEESLHRLIHRAARFTAVIDAPETGHDDPDPWTRAWAAALDDLRACALPAPWQRARDGIRAYALGCVHEASLRRTASLPPLDHYLPFRYALASGRWMAALVEIGGEFDLPPDEIGSPLVHAAQETALTAAFLDNELLSRGKEEARGEYDCGLIPVLLAEPAPRTLQQAVDDATALRDRIMDLHLRLAAAVRAGGSPGTRDYVELLGRASAGITTFSRDTLRYTTPHQPKPPVTSAATPPPRGPYRSRLPPQIGRWTQLAH
ncbi:terpene synthase family protein [Streptomyces lavendulae]|uniref:terpene synthase family protein n=1 Tax=Streptomyces lavendulae TaxID=1914 RepID=UPI00255277AB|nr:terpene synthase family protein [Streptomyces lavendulae]